MAHAASLLVLAGGESRRMGRAKALLPVAGATLIEYVAGRLRPVSSELLVSAPPGFRIPASLAGARHVVDRHPGAGPLAGIDAGLAAATAPAVLALACDMPYVTAASASIVLAALAGHAAAVPLVAGRAEPLFAAYARSAAPAIEAALGAGRYRARDVLRELDVAWVTGLDPLELRSLNTPRDYDAFLDALR